MSLFARLARDSIWLLMGRVGVQACMMVVTFLLAGRLGITGFGEYSFMAAAIVIGNTLTTFGSDMYLIREIARQPGFAQLSSTLLLQLILSCLFIILIFLFASHLPHQTTQSILALRVYSFALIPLAFFTVFTSVLRGCQKMDVYSLLNLIIAVLQVTAILVVIPHGTSVITLAWLLLGIQTLGAILAGMLCLNHIPGFQIIWHWSLREIENLFMACLPIAVIASLGIMYQKLSLLMLSLLGSAAMVGWFSVAARAVEAARIGQIAAATAMYPAMSKREQNEDSSSSFRLAWFYLILAACGVSILFFLFAEPLVEIFFGVDYLPSIPVLKILSLTLIPYTVNSFLSLRLLAARQEKVMIRVLFISLLILAFLNLWLIARAGQIGAGWALLIAESIQSALLLFEWRTKLVPYNKAFILQKGASHELPDLS